MKEINKGDEMNTKTRYVKEYNDYSSGKDRRITKLVNDIKRLSETIDTKNQAMKITWEELSTVDDVESFEKRWIYDDDFGTSHSYWIEKNGQGYSQYLELYDWRGDVYCFDNEMGNYYYKNLKVEIVDVGNENSYVHDYGTGWRAMEEE